MWPTGISLATCVKSPVLSIRIPTRQMFRIFHRNFKRTNSFEPGLCRILLKIANFSTTLIHHKDIKGSNLQQKLFRDSLRHIAHIFSWNFPGKFTLSDQCPSNQFCPWHTQTGNLPWLQSGFRIDRLEYGRFPSFLLTNLLHKITNL